MKERRPRGRRAYDKMKRAVKGRKGRGRNACEFLAALCQGRFLYPGLLARVHFTWSTMQWASLWPSSVIKTGVSLATQSALFCHPSQPPGTPWLPPLFPSVRPFMCSVRGLPVTASFTRSLPPLPLLCRQRTVFERHLHHQRTSFQSEFLLFSDLFRIIFMFYFNVSFCFLLQKQKCKIYLNLFPVFLI